MKSQPTIQFLTGLVSVSFRRLGADQIIEQASKAGLEGIEWGGDIHVPHGDLGHAQKIGDQTRAAGLAVAAYGSYYRAGVSESQGLAFERVLDTAIALQAPIIRIWAGDQGSREITETQRQLIVDDAIRVSNLAAQSGTGVSVEYHANTLTDTRPSAMALMEATSFAGLSSLWQPTTGWSHSEHCAALEEIIPWLTNIHVYNWRGNGERRPLAEATEHWHNFLEIVKNNSGKPRSPKCWLLLEFFKDDLIEQLHHDAATLKSLLNHPPP